MASVQWTGRHVLFPLMVHNNLPVSCPLDGRTAVAWEPLDFTVGKTSSSAYLHDEVGSGKVPGSSLPVSRHPLQQEPEKFWGFSLLDILGSIFTAVSPLYIFHYFFLIARGTMPILSFLLIILELSMAPVFAVLHSSCAPPCCNPNWSI